MEKYSVVIDDDKTKTASASGSCPQCGEKLRQKDYCLRCGTEPFEKRPEQKKEEK